MSDFQLGSKSELVLSTACADMQKVVRLALTFTDVDFSVIEAKRSPEKQRENIEKGVSWSMNSDHIPDDNGDVKAVDIYPWVNGATSHLEEHYNRVAKAMFRASMILNIPIKWGGFWRKPKTDKPHWSSNVKNIV